MRCATRTIAPVFTALLLALAGVTFIAAPAQANIGTQYHGGFFWYTDTDNDTITVLRRTFGHRGQSSHPRLGGDE